MTTPLRRLIRAVRAGWRKLRFRVWAARLGIQLRRNGGRLKLNAPHGAWLEGRPRIRAMMAGEGDGVFELEIGRDVRIEHGVVLEIWAPGTNRLTIGDGTVVGDGVRLELRSGAVELGEGVDLRTLVMLKSYGRLRVGDQAVLSRGVYVQCEEEIAIGEWAAIGEWVSVIDSDHAPDGGDAPVLRQKLHVEPVAVGSNVLVGRGSAVLRGARVGKNSLIAANSVVLRGSYPDAHLLAGSPASAVKPLTR